MKYALLLLLLVGCATAKITSYRDPALQKPYKSIAVWFPSADLAARRSIEEKVVKSCLEWGGIKGIASINVFPPTRVPTGEEIKTELGKHGAEALLTAANLQSNQTTAGYVTNNVGYTTPITSTGMFINIDLWDLKTGKKMWTSSVNASGDAYFVEQAVHRELCGALYGDGVIEKQAKTK